MISDVVGGNPKGIAITNDGGTDDGGRANDSTEAEGGRTRRCNTEACNTHSGKPGNIRSYRRDTHRSSNHGGVDGDRSPLVSTPTRRQHQYPPNPIPGALLHGLPNPT